MAQFYCTADELYPYYVVSAEPGYGLNPVDLPEDVVDRYLKADEEFGEALTALKQAMDPPCPECGHSTIRHQEWSSGWDYWGCLAVRCRCQHGKPEGR